MFVLKFSLLCIYPHLLTLCIVTLSNGKFQGLNKSNDHDIMN